MASRPHPHVNIPFGSRQPHDHTPSSSQTYLLQSPPQESVSLWTPEEHTEQYSSPPSYPSSSNHVSRHHDGVAPRISLDVPSRPHSRAASDFQLDGEPIVFPEPQLYRSASQRVGGRPAPSSSHRYAKSEDTLSPAFSAFSIGDSRPPSFYSTSSSPELSPLALQEALSDQTLSEEGLRRFQTGQLPSNDEVWHRLVPKEAVEVLGKEEAVRQSIIFEIIQHERDYVSDLEMIREVYIEPLRHTLPVGKSNVEPFIREVFFNMDEILAHHQRMLGALFERQRDQHPIIQSIADIVLDNALLWGEAYENYIKHYPYADAHHRKEVKRNARYQAFIQQCSQDPRVHKQDLISLLSRPVTRMPRLRLQLDSMLKKTVEDHPDRDTTPLVLDIIGDMVKASQPGIVAAEAKVKFWSLCESLVYQKGEMIDMDLYDDSRTLVHSGNLARRYRSDVGYGWADLFVALLDNYLLLLKPEQRPNKTPKHSVVSRPIPLEYLRLGVFNAPPENRKEKVEDGGLFESFRSHYRPVFPFTIYHAAAKNTRRYTLYAPTEAARDQWYNVLRDALAVRKVRQDTNMWFAPNILNDGFFTYSNTVVPTDLTGKIACATPLSSGGRSYLLVGCQSGVYIAQRGMPDFGKILGTPNTVGMIALQDHNKFIVHCADGLLSFSLEMLVRVATKHSAPEHLDATLERISAPDAVVLFFRACRIGSRTMILYASRSFYQASLHAVEVVRGSEAARHSRRISSSSLPSTISFRSFGEPLAVARDTHDVAVLNKMVGVCTDKGIQIVDPTNLTLSEPTAVIPKFTDADVNPPLYTLKTRCASAKPLGLVRCSGNDILVVFDELGCYVDRHGNPIRESGYLRWEAKATSYAHRGEHLLLFSPGFVEVRTLDHGKLVQVIEEEDVRLVYLGFLPADRTTLVAIRSKEGNGTIVDRLVELNETTEIITPRAGDVTGAWDEWDTLES